MSEPFIGQIQPFGFNFAPRGWAQCDGQLLQISQNSALFSLLGTTYGGDGRTTFALPDLRGRVAIHQGTGAGLTTRTLGSRSGQESVTLNTTQMPPHQHAVAPKCNGAAIDGDSPVNSYPALSESDIYNSAAGVNQVMAPTDSSSVGGGQAHANMQPFLTINFCIALTGLFPSRN